MVSVSRAVGWMGPLVVLGGCFFLPTEKYPCTRDQDCAVLFRTCNTATQVCEPGTASSTASSSSASSTSSSSSSGGASSSGAAVSSSAASSGVSAGSSSSATGPLSGSGQASSTVSSSSVAGSSAGASSNAVGASSSASSASGSGSLPSSGVPLAATARTCASGAQQTLTTEWVHGVSGGDAQAPLLASHGGDTWAAVTVLGPHRAFDPMPSSTTRAVDVVVAKLAPTGGMPPVRSVFTEMTQPATMPQHQNQVGALGVASDGSPWVVINCVRAATYSRAGGASPPASCATGEALFLKLNSNSGQIALSFVLNLGAPILVPGTEPEFRRSGVKALAFLQNDLVITGGFLGILLELNNNVRLEREPFAGESASEVEAFVLRMSPAGGPVWAHNMRGYGDSLDDVAVEGSNIFLSGSAGYNVGWPSFAGTGGGGFRLSLDGAGQVRWKHPYLALGGSTPLECEQRVSVAASNPVLFAGCFEIGLLSSGLPVDLESANGFVARVDDAEGGGVLRFDVLPGGSPRMDNSNVYVKDLTHVGADALGLVVHGIALETGCGPALPPGVSLLRLNPAGDTVSALALVDASGKARHVVQTGPGRWMVSGTTGGPVGPAGAPFTPSEGAVAGFVVGVKSP